MNVSRRSSKEQPITVPRVKETLERIGEEQLDQFQRRTLDYALKFSKVDTDDAAALAKKLMQDFELKEEEAVPIINCMPESIEEIRVFFLGGRRIMETSKLKAILDLLNQYRKKE
jgi:DNA-directed RNA polymerase subunit F